MTTLLIVDSKYVITEILECIFEDEGYTVVKTVSAVNALKVLDCVRHLALDHEEFLAAGALITMHTIQTAQVLATVAGEVAEPLIGLADQ